MKLYKVSLIAVFAAALMLSACNSNEEELPLSENYQTIVGEVQSLGGINVEAGITNLFKDDEGEIYYTFSGRYDLYSGDYYATRIEAYGVLREFESKDKAIFEIQRITEAEQLEEEEIVYEDVDYIDTDYGFSFTYSNDWSLEVLRDSVVLTAPVEDDDDEMEDSDVEDALPNYIVFANTGAVIVPEVSEPESEGSDEESSAELEPEEAELAEDIEDQIKNIVSESYGFLDGATVKTKYIGPDKMYALGFETLNSDLVYFVPRHEELFEVAFYHPSEGKADLQAQKNEFSTILATFRFVAYGDEQASEDEPSTEEEEEPAEDEEEPELAEPVLEVEKPDLVDNSVGLLSGTKPEQVSVPNLRSFTSNPYGFSISYPSSWYYSGGNGGYDFAMESLENDDVEALIRLDFNTIQTEGGRVSGANSTYTILVSDRYYTLTGPGEYYDLLKVMAESIAVVDADA